MSGASTETLGERLLALGAHAHAGSRTGLDTGDEALLRAAAQQLGALEAQHGVQLLDDGDTSLGAGLFVARAAPPGPARLARLLRSWESFDRAFELCEPDEEAALFDTRLWPFLEAAGLRAVGCALAQEHLFLIDERYVGLFPEECWDSHAGRHTDKSRDESADGSADENTDEAALSLRGLARVLEARRASAA